MFDPYQVFEARALGADCILVIMAAVTDHEAQALIGTAEAIAMDVLIEVHDEAELERALQLDADLIGINNRDLRSFETNLATSERLAPLSRGSDHRRRERDRRAGRHRRLQACGIHSLPGRRKPDAAGDVAEATRRLLSPALADAT
jgi:indole-3-glycerol phosphate synthase